MAYPEPGMGGKLLNTLRGQKRGVSADSIAPRMDASDGFQSGAISPPTAHFISRQG